MNLPSPAALTKRLVPLLDVLADHFGPQRWWTDTDPFEVIAGALLVQNTAWAGAAKAIENLRAAGALSVDGVLGLDELRCQELVCPSRAIRQKTAKLKAFAEHVRDAHDCDLGRMLRAPMEPLQRELLGIWGVGPETADAIRLYAARKPSFVVDTYTQRTLERLGVILRGVPRPALRALPLEALPQDPWQLDEAHGLPLRQRRERAVGDGRPPPLVAGFAQANSSSREDARQFVAGPTLMAAGLSRRRRSQQDLPSNCPRPRRTSLRGPHRLAASTKS